MYDYNNSNKHDIGHILRKINEICLDIKFT